MGPEVKALWTISDHATLASLCAKVCQTQGDGTTETVRVLVASLSASGAIVRISPREAMDESQVAFPVEARAFFGAEHVTAVGAAVEEALKSGTAKRKFLVEPRGTASAIVDALFLRASDSSGGAVCDLALVATGSNTKDTVGQHFLFLERIANDARDGLLITDEAGVILHVSRGATALFGYEPAEIIGQEITVLMHEPYRSRHGQYIQAFRTNGIGRILGIGPRELPARHKDNSTIPIELSVSEAEWNGKPVFIGLCRDISARMERERALHETQATLSQNVKMLETVNRELARQQVEVTALAESLKAARDEAQAANRAKSDFLATMSHEIRTPLNGIIGMAQVMATAKLPVEQREHLGVIIESSETLLELLNELLDLAKIESGRLSLEVRETLLSKLLAPIAEHWRRRALAKGLLFDIRLANDVPLAIEFDPVRVRQILDNLLSNAVKFTESGSVLLDLRPMADQGGGTALRFAVADTGVGIQPDRQAHIFDSFTQADTSITRRYGGTGLGLAISKKLVDLMDGDIGVESTPGVGTRFWIQIPLHAARVARPVETAPAYAPVPATVAPAPPVADEEQDRDSLSVLVAEDNLVNQKVVKTILMALGHRSTIAVNGREAIRLLESGQAFDLVLMDLHMPEMDGLTATRAIRSRGDRISAIPIVGLTASAMGQDRDECLAAGMNEFVTKPIKIDALAQALGEVMTNGSRTSNAFSRYDASA